MEQKCMKNPLTQSRLGEDNWLEPIIVCYLQSLTGKIKRFN